MFTTGRMNWFIYSLHISTSVAEGGIRYTLDFPLLFEMYDTLVTTEIRKPRVLNRDDINTKLILQLITVNVKDVFLNEVTRLPVTINNNKLRT